MRSPLADVETSRLIEAMLPDVPFDGWSRAALRRAARRIGMAPEAALALFPRGSADLVAAFSRWADRRMLDALAAPADGEGGLGRSQRIARALALRFEILAPWREAVRRALSVLVLPQNAALGARLLFETVDAMWYAAGDEASDISFYTKRATLAGIQAASVLYWLNDRSPGGEDTEAFIARRLSEVGRLGRSRRAMGALPWPKPFRLLRRSR
jgi:ubiquinone biosynthesis protein COQ9